MKKQLLLLLVLFTTVYACGQDTSLLKRPAYKLTVAVNKNNFYEEDLKAGPYVLPDKTIQLYPGETVYAEVEVAGGVIKNITAVKEIKDSAKTLTISFKQTANGGVHEMMMLKITNPFAMVLTYQASMFLFKQKKWVDTDVEPVRPGIAAIETWPDIIISIGVGGWKFQTK